MIKMSSASLLNSFVLTPQLILQFYCMFMSVASTAGFSMFDDKAVTDFFEQLNDLYEKHDIVENDQKIHHFFHYYNVKHVNVMCLFFKYACKNWQQLYVTMKKSFVKLTLSNITTIKHF